MNLNRIKMKISVELEIQNTKPMHEFKIFSHERAKIPRKLILNSSAVERCLRVVFVHQRFDQKCIYRLSHHPKSVVWIGKLEFYFTINNSWISIIIVSYFDLNTILPDILHFIRVFTIFGRRINIINHHRSNFNTDTRNSPEMRENWNKNWLYLYPQQKY